MSLFFLWGPSFMAEDGPKIIRFGPKMVPGRYGKRLLLLLFLHIVWLLFCRLPGWVYCYAGPESLGAGSA